jgi:ABC-type Na+ transport system ATPase subunit NatA
MSLHDVDKIGYRRGNPAINTQDELANAKAHATDGIAYRTEQNVNVARALIKDDQILIYDASNLRIIVGRLPDGTYGMAVSKQGFNVTDAYS